jgi:hypothetical protein
MSSKRLLLFDFGTEEMAELWDEQLTGDVFRALDLEELAHGEKYAVVQCATCRHYSDPPIHPPVALGYCDYPDSEGWSDKTDSDMVTGDQVGLGQNWLMVKPTFGCAAWEART